MNNLEKALDNLEHLDLTRPLLNAGLVIEGRAKELCPIDTGELRGSIRTQVDGDCVYVGTSKEYFPYVEFGTGLFAVNGDGRTDVPWVYKDLKGQWHSTVGQHPQPFLEDALH